MTAQVNAAHTVKLFEEIEDQLNLIYKPRPIVSTLRNAPLVIDERQHRLR
jgi:hypothetical protein